MKSVTDSIKEKELDEIYDKMFLESQKKQESTRFIMETNCSQY